ncbi:hypothetical protein [uncultured Paludibaculum sp.]|uniref:hypothetical protein n=1 Tax=uncultured Paludibaculum sp. TaxID=1765020 RepID=UPI002AAC137A|nr:hypothetical protein [uncultured Paludibaculum sp.]
MAVSDLYVAQYLLDATQAAESPLVWQAEDGGSFSTHLNGVKLSLFHARTLGWSGLCLSLSRGEEVTYVEEPRPVALFGRKFRTDDDERLSAVIQHLAHAVSRQCQARKLRAWTLRDSIRESLYRRILFPDADRG